MKPVWLLFAGLAAAPGVAAVQNQWVPGEIIIWIRATSVDQVDWQGLEQGELRTGLTSLDSLIRATAVRRIVPLEPIAGRYKYVLIQFAEGTNVQAMSALYATNEHVEYAGPNGTGPTTVDTAPWSLVKVAACGAPAGARALAPGGPIAAPAGAGPTGTQAAGDRQ